MMLRNSERQAFLTCRHRWGWTWRDGRQSLSAPTALRFGDLVHRALDAYRPPGTKFGPPPAQTFERLYNEQAKELGDQGFDVFSDEKWEPALDLGIGMLEGYVRRFKDEDSEWEVISSEQTFQLPVRIRAQDLPDGFDPDRWASAASFRFKVVGTFDGIWRNRSTKRIVFKEYKTAAAIKLDGLPLDEQAGWYWTYGPRWLREQGILKPAQMPSSILYTFLRKAVPDPEAVTDSEGRLLNKPTKAALLEAYGELERELPPRGDGAKGSPLVDDLIRDLASNTKVDPMQLGEIAASQPASYFARVPVYRDAADRANVHRRACAIALDIAAARNGAAVAYKNPGPLHMQNCRGCSVRDACEVHETGGDWQSVLDASMIEWNPYAAHELPERH